MVSIIGAGPAGCFLACLLAKKGHKVNLFEEHNNIGKPIQCAGLLTEEVKKFVKEGDFVINKINSCRLHGKVDVVDIKFKHSDWVVDRAEFDKYLAKLAEDAGANLFLNHRLIALEKQGLWNLHFSNNAIVQDKIVIGADGPTSLVYKRLNKKKRNFFVGMQAVVKGNFHANVFDFYPLNKGFGYVVPESSKKARVGVVVRNNVASVFNDFVKNRGKVLEKQGGLIPVYDSNIKTNDNGLFLLGDSAGMVKATSAGGVVQALKAAVALSKSIEDKKKYSKIWKNSIGKDLWFGLKARNILDKFSTKDYDDLFALLSQHKLRAVLGKVSRDNIFSLATICLMKEPRLIKFISKLF